MPSSVRALNTLLYFCSIHVFDLSNAYGVISLSRSLATRPLTILSLSLLPGFRVTPACLLTLTCGTQLCALHHHFGLLISAQVAHDDAEVSNPGADASKLTDAMLEEDEHDECRIAELLQARRSASLSPRLSAAAPLCCGALHAPECLCTPTLLQPRLRHRMGMHLAGLPVGRTTRAGRARRELG